MNLISTPWTCQGCGGAFISTPPDSGLCPDCLRTAECACPHPGAPLYVCPDAQAACAQCGGPVCVRCGRRLMLLIPVTASASGGPLREVSGDGG
jgi:hypothetical protein